MILFDPNRIYIIYNPHRLLQTAFIMPPMPLNIPDAFERVYGSGWPQYPWVG